MTKVKFIIWGFFQNIPILKNVNYNKDDKVIEKFKET